MYTHNSSLRNKQGSLQLYTNKKWKNYMFKVTGNMYLHYFKLKNFNSSNPPIEQIFLSTIESVGIPSRTTKGGMHIFEVKHSGRSSPWTISASSHEEQMEWMEAILPGSTSRAQSGIKRAPLLKNKALSSSFMDFHNAIKLQHNLSIETPSQSKFPSMPQSCSLTDLAHYGHGTKSDSDPSASLTKYSLRAESDLLKKNNAAIMDELEDTDEYVEMRGSENDRGLSIDSSMANYANVPSNTSNSYVNVGAGYFGRSDDIQNYKQSQHKTTVTDCTSTCTNTVTCTEYMDMSGPDYMDMAPLNKQVYDYVDFRRVFKTKFGTCKKCSNKKPSQFSSTDEPCCPITVTASDECSQVVQQSFTKDQISPLTQILQKVQVRSGTAICPTEDLNQLVLTTKKLSDSVLVAANDSQWAKAVHEEKFGSCPVTPFYPETSHDMTGDVSSISRHSLTNMTMIGEGRFGEVYRAVYSPKDFSSQSDIPVAIKIAHNTVDTNEEFLREMTVMSKMIHPNIVRLYGIVTENVPSHWIVLEYLPHGDLKSYLCKSETKKPYDTLIKYMVDVAMGMHHLVENGLVHRNLAAHNVMMGQDGLCKVADVGLLQRVIQDDSNMYQNIDMPCHVRWAAPEILSERKFSVASDIWSYGILLWEILQPHKLPYERMDNLEVAMQVSRGYRMPIPRGCPPMIARVMKACVHADPAKRPSFLAIVSLLTAKLIL